MLSVKNFSAVDMSMGAPVRGRELVGQQSSSDAGRPPTPYRRPA